MFWSRQVEVKCSKRKLVLLFVGKQKNGRSLMSDDKKRDEGERNERCRCDLCLFILEAFVEGLDLCDLFDYIRTCFFTVLQKWPFAFRMVQEKWVLWRHLICDKVLRINCPGSYFRGGFHSSGR